MWSFGTTMTIAHDKDKLDKKEVASSSSQLLTVQSPSEMKITVTQSDPTPNPYTQPSIFSQRSMKQLGLFFAGAGFLSLSTLITRRSITRKRIATIPSFFYPSNRPVNTMSSDSSLIALEALNLATLNVLGFGVMCTGGLAWAFDISSIDDLRKKARGHIGPNGGYTDEEAEREVEEWVAKVLGRKEEKEQEAGSPPKKDA
ncbi:hypothetical protein UCREL1_2333 [Eutypa lata UCREL1]|uniref:Altered inheritance of mitochondria protein 11 n=1 Tax=Eutypa lata (strain UCR-EL1) TaxID=1287681 RepID=M7T281_EUTLA|nr:hypothetical protein UCREL1_2333 [Eutypa lata UCREL1]